MSLGATLAVIALFAFLWLANRPDVTFSNKDQEHVTSVAETMPTLAVPERKPAIIYKCPPKRPK